MGSLDLWFNRKLAAKVTTPPVCRFGFDGPADNQEEE
jgi:hypothetical protein